MSSFPLVLAVFFCRGRGTAGLLITLFASSSADQISRDDGCLDYCRPCCSTATWSAPSLCTRSACKSYVPEGGAVSCRPLETRHPCPPAVLVASCALEADARHAQRVAGTRGVSPLSRSASSGVLGSKSTLLRSMAMSLCSVSSFGFVIACEK